MDPVFFAVYFILLFSITAVVLVIYLIPLDIWFKIEHYGQITHILALSPGEFLAYQHGTRG